METNIGGEISNLELNKIKEFFQKKLGLSILEKSIEEISVSDKMFDISVYRYYSKILKNTFLVGGTFFGDYYEAVRFVNKIATLLTEEKVSFELEVENGGKLFCIKNVDDTSRSTLV